MSAPRGKPFEPGNKLGRGRPKGSRNKSGSPVQDLINKYALPLTGKCIGEALKGDRYAMRLCMERILPVMRDSPVRIKIPSIRNLADVGEAARRMIQDAAGGKMTPGELEKMMNALQTHTGIIETSQIEPRLAQLEEAINAPSNDEVQQLETGPDIGTGTSGKRGNENE